MVLPSPPAVEGVGGGREPGGAGVQSGEPGGRTLGADPGAGHPRAATRPRQVGITGPLRLALQLLHGVRSTDYQPAHPNPLAVSRQQP